MSSASTITNMRKIRAIASVTKVQYPDRISNKNVLLASENCSPNFSRINYTTRKGCCVLPIDPDMDETLACILDGNGSCKTTYDGTIAPHGVTYVLQSIGTCPPPNGIVFDSGNANPNPESCSIQEGAIPIVDSVYTIIFDGGN